MSGVLLQTESPWSKPISEPASRQRKPDDAISRRYAQAN
jgi:hypothetical protein